MININVEVFLFVLHLCLNGWTDFQEILYRDSVITMLTFYTGIFLIFLNGFKNFTAEWRRAQAKS